MTARATPKARVAARNSVDPDRLLPGEPPDSDLHEVASRWLGVYRDLLGAKRLMLRSAESRLAGASPEARREFRTVDATILVEERRRVQRRLDYWRRRVRTLKAKPA